MLNDLQATCLLPVNRWQVIKLISERGPLSLCLALPSRLPYDRSQDVLEYSYQQDIIALRYLAIECSAVRSLTIIKFWESDLHQLAEASGAACEAGCVLALPSEWVYQDNTENLQLPLRIAVDLAYQPLNDQ